MAEPIIQAQKHRAITASANILSPKPYAIYVAVGGSASIVMPDPATGVETTISYTLVAGSVLPIQPLRITAITSATLIGLY